VRIFGYDIFEEEAKSAKSNDGNGRLHNHNPACTRTRHGAAAAYHDSRPSRTRWSSPVGILRVAVRCAPTLQPRDGSRSN
jgi:hypothetical protein